jgi:hypothetical protein
MGLGFLKRLVKLGAVLSPFFAAYLVPEYWPDHAMASDAIVHHDTDRLRTLLARGLAPEDRSQWRSFLRRTLGRTTSVGVEDYPDLGPADESLLDYALGKCATSSALLLVDAGAKVAVRDKWGWTLLGRAASCRNETLTSAMLRRGADASASEPDGGTVLWEPTNLGWRQRPFGDDAVTAALQHAGARRPSGPAVKRD